MTPPGQRLRALSAGLLVQGKEAGAWPVVRAVLDAEVEGGQLWGPRVFGLRGTPRREPVPSHMTDPAVTAELRAAGSELTGTDPHLGFQGPRGRWAEGPETEGPETEGPGDRGAGGWEARK